MNCLVTGSAGFIGTHLVERLKRDGFKVKEVDVKNENPQPFEWVKEKDLKGIEVVFHLAAYKMVDESIEKPLVYYRNNFMKMSILLDQCHKAGVKKVVFASSSAVYGDTIYFPTGEKRPLKPMSPYAISKAAGELLCQYYSKLGMPCVSLRLFNVYGPGCTDNAIPIFIQNVIDRKASIIYGGTQERDFVYVSDVVEAFVRASKDDYTNGAFNIGSGKPTSINDLYIMINDKICEPISTLKKAPRLEPLKTQAKLTKAHMIWRWKPKVSLSKGLTKTIASMVQWEAKEKAVK